MTGRLITIATAILLGSSCAHAQVRGMSTPTPTAGLGTTSPLGMSTSGTAVAPTGIPLGAAPFATPGVSSGATNGVTVFHGVFQPRHDKRDDGHIEFDGAVRQ